MTYATISSKGQITLPVKLLAAMGLKPSDRIEIAKEGGAICLRKAVDLLALRGSLKGLKAADERGAMMRGVASHARGKRA